MFCVPEILLRLTRSSLYIDSKCVAGSACINSESSSRFLFKACDAKINWVMIKKGKKDECGVFLEFKKTARDKAICHIILLHSPINKTPVPDELCR